jgi:protein CpxP
MKLNSKTLSLAFAGIAALIIMSAAVVFSQGPQDPQGPPPPREGFGRGPGGPGGPRGGGFPMFRDLNLSDEQKAQIKKIMESEAANTKDLHDKLKALHESEPAPFTTAFDEASVRATAEARAKIEVELDVAHARTMSQIASILTTEQKQQLASHRSQFREGPPPPPQPQQ